ncbi:MAG: hypothetical protein H6Q04_324 [Acidobacteria bacterium]|nr:hypothetical protein [Acidobacteriota bacterium]
MKFQALLCDLRSKIESAQVGIGAHRQYMVPDALFHVAICKGAEIGPGEAAHRPAQLNAAVKESKTTSSYG